VVYILFLATLVIRSYSRSIKRHSVALFMTLGVLFVVGGMALSYKVYVGSKEAIAVAGRVEIKLGPFDASTTHSILYEGTKVKVLRWKKDWAMIERPGKKPGWVKTSTLEVI